MRFSLWDYVTCLIHYQVTFEIILGVTRKYVLDKKYLKRHNVRKFPLLTTFGLFEFDTVVMPLTVYKTKTRVYLHNFAKKLLFICIMMVGCFGFNGPLRQYFSLNRAVSQREGERGEKW